VQIVLEVVEGPHCGKRFTFDGHDNFIVGRASCAHFRLPKKDPYFSRIHFMMEINPPHCLLVDMKSTNGTRVNGRRVEAAYLQRGDLIEGGDTVLRLSLVGAPDEPVGEMPCPPPLPIVEPGLPLQDRPLVDAPRTPPPEMAGFPPPAPPAPGKAMEASPDDPRLETTDSFQAILPEGVLTPSTAAPVSADEAPAVPGYRIEGQIGQGGMGVVYLATRASDETRVALKTIRVAAAGAMPRDVQRFLREANTLRQLRHPNIVAFHEMRHDGEQFAFVMEYVRGVNAADLLDREGPLSVGHAVRLASELLEALDYAHGQGFVHRDVKPANVLVTRGEKRATCKLADFGLARVYQASTMSGITMLGDTGGTLPYMPPEQITHYRDASPAADQYSAAATLYRLLTGHHIFDTQGLSNADRLVKILFDPPAPIQSRGPDVPDALARVIHRAIEKKPADRFPDVASFRQALLPFAS